MSEMETVKKPKSVADCVRSNNWFKSYRNMEEFIMEAIRDFLEAKSCANIVHLRICQQSEIACMHAWSVEERYSSQWTWTLTCNLRKPPKEAVEQ